MLLRQNFRRGHQRRLLVIARCQIGRRSGHHGLAAAHVTLDQPVHRRAAGHVGSDLADGPLLGIRQFKGQGPIKGLQIGVFIGRGGFARSGGPQQAQARGEHKEFLKHQPPLGHLRLLHGSRLVDGIVGPLRRQDAVLAADLLRNDLRRHVTDGQSLPHRLQNSGVAQPRRQRINGQHPPGGHRRGIHRLEGGIGHAVAGEIPVDGPVENVLLAVAQLVCDIAVVEEGHIQPAGVIGQLDLRHVQALADVGSTGRVHHHRLEAGGLVRLQLADVHQFRPVLVAPWEVADQIPEGADIQVFKLLCPGGPHALQNGNRIR